jgi:hypothetical protein
LLSSRNPGGVIVWKSRPQMIDEEEPEREQHLVEVPAPANRPQESAEGEAERDAEDDRDRGGEDERHAVVLDQLVAHVGAEEVEAAVREVEHVEHAEDEREPDREDEDQHPQSDTVEDAREVLVEEVRSQQVRHGAPSIGNDGLRDKIRDNLTADLDANSSGL